MKTLFPDKGISNIVSEKLWGGREAIPNLKIILSLRFILKVNLAASVSLLCRKKKPE